MSLEQALKLQTESIKYIQIGNLHVSQLLLVPENQ